MFSCKVTPGYCFDITLLFDVSYTYLAEIAVFACFWLLFEECRQVQIQPIITISSRMRSIPVVAPRAYVAKLDVLLASDPRLDSPNTFGDRGVDGDGSDALAVVDDGAVVQDDGVTITVFVM